MLLGLPGHRVQPGLRFTYPLFLLQVPHLRKQLSEVDPVFLDTGLGDNQ